MSMGGGSGGVSPIRRSARPTFSTGGSGYQPPAPAPAASEGPSADYGAQVEPSDPSLPTYVSVGGGLSTVKIVKKLPQELQEEPVGDCSLQKIVKYMISPEIAVTPEEQNVADNVRQRIELPDCRLLINNVAGLGTPYNLGKEHLQDKLGDYLVKKEQRTQGSGTVEVNFSDISIVTHDEGGYMESLERLLPR